MNGGFGARNRSRESAPTQQKYKKSSCPTGVLIIVPGTLHEQHGKAFATVGDRERRTGRPSQTMSHPGPSVCSRPFAFGQPSAALRIDWVSIFQGMS
ncbi:hypothetical protein BWU74_23950 [Paraburkholderia caledonica]|nr:hypothetical protein BWU74_23950 [Burkholderia sp. Bk]